MVCKGRMSRHLYILYFLEKTPLHTPPPQKSAHPWGLGTYLRKYSTLSTLSSLRVKKEEIWKAEEGEGQEFLSSFPLRSPIKRPNGQSHINNYYILTNYFLTIIIKIIYNYCYFYYYSYYWLYKTFITHP